MSYIDKVDGRYRARWRDPAGRERAKTFRRREDARQWLVQIDASKLTGGYVDPHRGKVKTKDFAALWLAGRDVRPSTAARDSSYVNNYIVPTFGDVPLGRITVAEVAAWKMDLLGRGLSPATVSKAITLLKMMLNDAVDNALIASNPAMKVKLPRIEREEMRFLMPGEVRRLAEAIDDRYRALVYVGAYGGLRIGELAGLRVGDVDFFRHTVDVQRQVVEVGGRLTIGPLKTKAARRQVTLPEFVANALTLHITIVYRDAQTKPVDAPVFPSPEGGLLSRTRFRNRVWLPACGAAGLEGVRVHDLRHTAVSLWIAAGANPKEVARRAGHTSVRTVFDIYGHLLPTDADQGIEQLEAMARSADSEGNVIHLVR